jgi:hypothetical protein
MKMKLLSLECKTDNPGDTLEVMKCKQNTIFYTTGNSDNESPEIFLTKKNVKKLIKFLKK